MIRTTLKEFRDFALKGNVVDLSVAVILGLAFGLVVNSMVNDVLMPPIGRLAGNLDFSNLYISLTDKLDEDNRAKATTQPAIQPTTDSVVGEVTSLVKPSNRLSLDEVRQKGYAVIAYGKFITTIINFVIQAFSVFMLIKIMTTVKKRFEKEQVVAPPPPPADVVLLTEIRDLLKNRQA